MSPTAGLARLKWQAQQNLATHLFAPAPLSCPSELPTSRPMLPWESQGKWIPTTNLTSS